MLAAGLTPLFENLQARGPSARKNTSKLMERTYPPQAPTARTSGTMQQYCPLVVVYCAEELIRK